MFNLTVFRITTLVNAIAIYTPTTTTTHTHRTTTTTRYFYSSPAMHIIKKLPLITPDYDASINPDFDLLAYVKAQLALVYALFSDVTQSN